MRQDDTTPPRTERSHSDGCCCQHGEDGRGMLARKRVRSPTVPQFRKVRRQKRHTRKRFTLSGRHPLRSFCILCACCVHRGTFVLPVRVLLGDVRSTPGVVSGRDRGQCWCGRFCARFGLQRRCIYNEKEQSASLSSSLWLHAVLCALCSLPKV